MHSPREYEMSDNVGINLTAVPVKMKGNTSCSWRAYSVVIPQGSESSRFISQCSERQY